MHDRFNGIFYGPHLPVVEPGPWYHTFQEHTIKTAITADHAGFDWDMALSILGHDVLVKESYRNLLRFSGRPDLFIDIGANYGTHSILFLVCGVRTISFEPNALCHRSFRELCLMNNVIPQIEEVALGVSNEPLQLSFPQGAEWLGSTKVEVVETLKTRHSLISRTVQQKRLDDYVSALAGNNDIVIKIDTEGGEADVLRGAGEIIDRFHPTIIFECLPGARTEMLSVVQDMKYKVVRLPLRRDEDTPAMSLDAFHNAPETNFGAIPK
jgi:FkbM family methyltransferase